MPAEPLAEGLDVSWWQSKEALKASIDWQKVKNSGVVFVFIKASGVPKFAANDIEGRTKVDTSFMEHWNGAKAAGLPRGAYHFFRPLGEPVAQVTKFCQVLQNDPGELPPTLDVENNFVDEKKNIKVDNSVLIEKVRVALLEIERQLQRKPIIYTGPGFWNGCMIDRKTGQPPAWVADYPLWVANYKVKTPLVPKGWGQWTFWQYAEDGSVDGCPDPTVDRNRFNGTVADFINWRASLNAVPAASTKPQPPKRTMPHITNQAMLNLFFFTFGKSEYWKVVTRAGLGSIAQGQARQAIYAGPPIEELPLTPTEQAALLAHLAAGG